MEQILRLTKLFHLPGTIIVVNSALSVSGKQENGLKNRSFWIPQGFLTRTLITPRISLVFALEGEIHEVVKIQATSSTLRFVLLP
jgi:hypothetical protein